MKPLARAVKLSQKAPYITNCIRIAKKTYARSKKIEIEGAAAMPLIFTRTPLFTDEILSDFCDLKI